MFEAPVDNGNHGAILEHIGHLTRRYAASGYTGNQAHLP